MLRLLTMSDQGMRGKVDSAQSEASRSHRFTTIEINKGLAMQDPPQSPSVSPCIASV